MEPRFPSLGVEKEFAQLAGAERAVSASERQQVLEIVSRPENHYLARALCWVMTVQGADAFSLTVSGHDVDDLVEAARPGRLTFVSGVAAPGGCLGAMDVAPAHLLTFDRDDFVAQVAAAVAGEADDGDAAAAGEVPQGGDSGSAQSGGTRNRETWSHDIVDYAFGRVLARRDNMGISAEHRAVNYLALRYPPMYQVCADQYAAGSSLVALDASHDHTGQRVTVTVRLVFRNRRTDLQSQYACRVDVEEVFPFLASPLQQTFDA